MKRGFKARANRLSKKIRVKLDLKPKDYLDPRLLAKKMKVKIFNPEELELSPTILKTLVNTSKNEWSALGATINGAKVIFLNSSHPDTRIEASIMHELAHFLLKHEPMGAVSYFGIPITRFNKEQEEEAEFLGGCLQIPGDCIFPLFAFEDYTIKSLADHFHCSKQVARMRYNLSGTKYKLANYKNKLKAASQ